MMTLYQFIASKSIDLNPPFYISYAPGIFIMIRCGKQHLPAVVSTVSIVMING